VKILFQKNLPKLETVPASISGGGAFTLLCPRFNLSAGRVCIIGTSWGLYGNSY